MKSEQNRDTIGMTTMDRVADKSVVFIDGVCHLCQGLVRFIIPRDPKARFMFVSLQDEKAQGLLKAGNLMEHSEHLNTVILLEHGKYYTESTAVLRIARRLRFPWPAAYTFILIPPQIRNSVYRYIARNRYRWFGRDEQCLLPTEELRRRFL
ncbi:thiol-disulfide oxidoreductase DCC family protein [Paenibacillus sp. sgz500958]|uniref:thiol-disulfide oxidoreductase DCC family protein n=1 Tax=Paenibacillus sp. sgz500958 TaxID=3242475 RepID=UPI0036D21A99